MNEADLIGKLRNVWRQLGDHLAALATRLELPEWSHEAAVLALKRHELLVSRQGLSIALVELGLVVEGINVTESADTLNDEDVSRRRLEVSLTGEVRLCRIYVRSDRA